MAVQYDLTNFKCLVTGGVKGIGRAIVNLLCESKAKVYFCDLNADEVNEYLNTMRANGYDIYGTVCDVSKPEDRKKLIAKVNVVFDKTLDVFINNASKFLIKPLVDCTENEYHSIMNTHVDAAFHLSQLCHPILKNSKKGGRVIYMGSAATGGPRTLNPTAVYSMSKACYTQLAANLACEWAKDRIRVNCVMPGNIATETNLKLQENKQYYEEAINMTPIKRFGNPNEVANVCAFLSSSAASFITGTTFNVDGGYTIFGS